MPARQIALHLGGLQAVGICGIQPGYPRQTLLVALASFGLLPLLLFKLRPYLRSSLANQGFAGSLGAEDTPGRALLLRFSLLYGTLSFLLAPLLGRSVARLFDYAWPLFLVALPLLLAEARFTFTSNPAAALFVALHLALSWSLWWSSTWHPRLLPEFEIGLYLAGWLVLCRYVKSKL